MKQNFGEKNPGSTQDQAQPTIQVVVKKFMRAEKIVETSLAFCTGGLNSRGGKGQEAHTVSPYEHRYIILTMKLGQHDGLGVF